MKRTTGLELPRLLTLSTSCGCLLLKHVANSYGSYSSAAICNPHANRVGMRPTSCQRVIRCSRDKEGPRQGCEGLIHPLGGTPGDEHVCGLKLR